MVVIVENFPKFDRETLAMNRSPIRPVPLILPLIQDRYGYNKCSIGSHIVQSKSVDGY